MDWRWKVDATASGSSPTVCPSNGCPQPSHSATGYGFLQYFKPVQRQIAICTECFSIRIMLSNWPFLVSWLKEPDVKKKDIFITDWATLRAQKVLELPGTMHNVPHCSLCWANSIHFCWTQEITLLRALNPSVQFHTHLKFEICNNNISYVLLQLKLLQCDKAIYIYIYIYDDFLAKAIPVTGRGGL
jgi:hypothetical protein